MDRGRAALLTLPPFSIMTGAPLTFLLTIWDQVAPFQPAIFFAMCLTLLKSSNVLATIHGFSLHQLQQMFDRILVFEVVYACTPSPSTGKKINILYSTADHDSVTK